MRCFIAGSIATKVDGLNECLEGAVVSLLRGSTKIKETTSDPFGDFKIDDLESNSGRYRLEFNYHGKEVKTVSEWKKDKQLNTYPLIMPNPLTGEEGSTKDGKPSAHFEHTIVIQEDGPEILT